MYTRIPRSQHNQIQFRNECTQPLLKRKVKIQSISTIIALSKRCVANVEDILFCRDYLNLLIFSQINYHNLIDHRPSSIVHRPCFSTCLIIRAISFDEKPKLAFLLYCEFICWKILPISHALTRNILLSIFAKKI